MKLTGKWVKLMVLCLAVVMVLAACSGGNSGSGKGGNNDGTNQTATSKPADPAPVVENADPITLTVGSWADPAEQANIEAVFEVFKQRFPYVSLEYVALEGHPTNVAITMAAAGNMPDVVWLSDGDITRFVGQDLLEPLSAHFDANMIDLGDVNQAMLDYGNLDGDYYFAPRDMNHIVTFVNKTLLEQEGIPMPKNGWGWDEFKNICNAVSKKDASGEPTQWCAQVHMGWIPQWSAIALGEGGEYLNVDTAEVSLSEPRVVQSFKNWLDMVKDGQVIHPWGEYQGDMFNEGKVAFQFHVKPIAPGVQDASQAKGFEWDVVTFPQMAQRYAVGSGTSGYAVNKDSKHVKEAAAFVSTFLTVDGQRAFGSSGLSVPVLLSMANDSVWRDTPVPGKNADAYVADPENDVARLTDIHLTPEAAGAVSNGVIEAFQKYLNGEASLEDSLKALDETINAMPKRK